VDLVITLGRTLGFSLAAGVNLYATVALIGLAAHFDWVQLPDQFAIFDNWWIIGAAVAMYAVEFVADKVPWFDSVWVAVHTFIRPVGGALIAVASLGQPAPEMAAFAALLGGSVAAGSHFTKAGARVAANASPEPFSNWILSLAEDVFVVLLGLLTLRYPVAALGVSAAILLGMALTARWLWRRWRRKPGPT